MPRSHSHSHSEPQSTTTNSKPQDPTTLALISAVLDFIRANLSNILSTWGADSPQYISARDIMQSYLAENVRRIHGEDHPVDDSEIDELMAGLSLSADPHPHARPRSKIDAGFEVGCDANYGGRDAQTVQGLGSSTSRATATRTTKEVDEMEVN